MMATLRGDGGGIDHPARSPASEARSPAAASSSTRRSGIALARLGGRAFFPLAAEDVILA